MDNGSQLGTQIEALYVSEWISFSTSEISRKKGGEPGGRGGERRGKPHVEVVLQKWTSSKPVRAVAMGLPWVKKGGQAEPAAPMLVLYHLFEWGLLVVSGHIKPKTCQIWTQRTWIV